MFVSTDGGLRRNWRWRMTTSHHGGYQSCFSFLSMASIPLNQLTVVCNAIEEAAQRPLAAAVAIMSCRPVSPTTSNRDKRRSEAR